MSFDDLPAPYKDIDGFRLYFRDELAIIAMDRGPNVMHMEFIQTMNTLLDHVEENEECKGLITTGVGKFYCNGLDIASVVQLNKNQATEFMVAWSQLYRRFLSFPIPTIAAINGHCFAGGVIFALTHDMRIMRAGKKGWICLSETRLGMRFPTYMVSMLRQKLNPSALNYVVVLAAYVTADEALQYGVTQATVPEEHLLSQSAKMLKYACREGYQREHLATMKADFYKETIGLMDAYGPEGGATREVDLIMSQASGAKSNL